MDGSIKHNADYQKTDDLFFTTEQINAQLEIEEAAAAAEKALQEATNEVDSSDGDQDVTQETDPLLPFDMSHAEETIITGTDVSLTSDKPAKKTKGKATIISPDPLHNAAFAVENLKAEEARKEVKRLIAGTEFDLFKLGGVLAVVHTKEFWSEYGFQDFRTYLEQEHGLNYRKAMYMISIYYGVVEYDLVWADIESLGWTKLKVLLNPSASTVVTAANIQMWLEKAKSMTVLQLESAIAGALKGPDGNATEQDAGKTVTTMTFKLHEDQKATVREALEKAKEVGGTDFDTVALEMMALEYMNKPATTLANTPSEGSLGLIMQAHGWEKVLAEFEKVWPNIELTVDVPAVD